MTPAPMNLFSSYLNQWSDDADFEGFLRQWDTLESTVVRVYRQKMTVDEAAPDFDAIWPRLRADYPRWQPVLEPYWRQTRAAGEPTATDPFLRLLDIQHAADIPGDWGAMQHLPAAREAINRYLVAHGSETGDEGEA